MLKVTDLAIARGGIPLLNRLDFQVSAGSALVVRGPNGIGKTTLLRCLAGLCGPVSGKIETNQEIAFSTHSDAIKATLTVAENLRFWGRVFGTTDITAAMRAFDLDFLSDRPAGFLSAGQKRRLGLARLLLSSRKLWILDEPTVSLDAASVDLFQDTLTCHLSNGGAAVLSTHLALRIKAAQLDLGPFKAPRQNVGTFNEAFL